VICNLWPGSPAKRSASRVETAAMPHRGTFPGLRRKRLTRATGPQTVMNRSPAKRSASRVEAAATLRRGTFPGLRRKRLTRATGPQTVMNRSQAKRSASRGGCRS
ncbi:TPA: hypothetical protein OTT52_004729, partial [Klebsiella michiganensis]|nr:hypothetical protein [Klebsiella michiganensis]